MRSSSNFIGSGKQWEEQQMWNIFRKFTYCCPIEHEYDEVKFSQPDMLAVRKVTGRNKTAFS